MSFFVMSDIMTADELYNYISNRKYRCSLCSELQKLVIEKGLNAIDEWDGMICAGIEDMIIRLDETRTGQEYHSFDIFV